MRISAKVTLAVSIVLLILGIGLVVYGAYASIPQPQVYEYSAPGRYAYSYSYYYSSSSPASFTGELCSRLGRLSFLAGLATMFIFVYLAVQPVVDRPKKAKVTKECKCEAKPVAEECKGDKNSEDTPKCNCEEVKAEPVVEDVKPDTVEKKTETPTVIHLGAPDEKTE